MMAFLTHSLAPPATLRSRPRLCSRRRPMRMSETKPEQVDAEVVTPASGSAQNGTDGIKMPSMPSAPSFDTGVFTEFVENAQQKIEELSARVQEIDPEELVGETKTNGIGLVDNFLAGDWLNRGELYGAVQLAFVLLLLRSPGILDSIVGFIVGPATLLAGAGLSGKALWDLGRKQLSIWPAPVPGAELRTDGMYGYIRHPIYAGLLLASIGFAVSTGSPERFALTLAMTAFLAKKIEVEEEFLSKAYDGWQEYVDEVAFKLIPNLW